MNGFVLNLLLALAWVAISGDVSLGNLVIGFGLGLVVLFFTRRIVGQPTYLLRMWRALSLLVFFVWELILANLRVAYDVLTPGYHLRPGVVAIPLDARTDMEITLLANMITLTPGSFTLDVSADRRVLYVHTMYLDEDVDVLLAPLLAAHGIDCLTTLAAGNLRLSDAEQLALAHQESRVLITHNRTDFESLAVSWWRQQRDHSGIVLAMRRADTYELARHILPVLQLYDQAGWRNTVLYA